MTHLNQKSVKSILIAIRNSFPAMFPTTEYRDFLRGVNVGHYSMSRAHRNTLEEVLQYKFTGPKFIRMNRSMGICVLEIHVVGGIEHGRANPAVGGGSFYGNQAAYLRIVISNLPPMGLGIIWKHYSIRAECSGFIIHWLSYYLALRGSTNPQSTAYRYKNE